MKFSLFHHNDKASLFQSGRALSFQPVHAVFYQLLFPMRGSVRQDTEEQRICFQLLQKMVSMTEKPEKGRKTFYSFAYTVFSVSYGHDKIWRKYKKQERYFQLLSCQFTID